MPAVILDAYTDAWPAAFARERSGLLAVFASNHVQIEHIGSTAVPGLIAKPVLDVLLGVNQLSDIEARIPLLAGLGFVYVSKYERELPQRRYFVKSAAGEWRVHLHGVVHGSPIWRQHVTFRNALLANAALANRYAELKLRLATEFADDKAAYTDAKGPFIRSVLAGISASEAEIEGVASAK